MYFCRIGGKGKQRYRTRAEASVTSTLHGCRLNTKNLSERAETARKGVIHWYQSIFLCDTQQLHFHPIQCLLDNIKQNREKRGKRERHQMATRQFFLSHGPSRSPSFIVVIYCEPQGKLRDRSPCSGERQRDTPIGSVDYSVCPMIPIDFPTVSLAHLFLVKHPKRLLSFCKRS